MSWLRVKISENWRFWGLISYYLIKLMYFFKNLFDHLLLPLVARDFMTAKFLINFAEFWLGEKSTYIALLEHLVDEFLSTYIFKGAFFVLLQFECGAFFFIRWFARMTIFNGFMILRSWAFLPWFMLAAQRFLSLYVINKFLNESWLWFYCDRTPNF